MAISSGSVHIQDPIVLMAHSDRLQRFSQRRDWLFPFNVRSEVISIRWNVRCMNIFWWNCKNRLATICYNLPRIRTFVWNAWKSRGAGLGKGFVPLLYPYFENFVNRTALENMNMICGERSSCRNFFSLWALACWVHRSFSQRRNGDVRNNKPPAIAGGATNLLYKKITFPLK